jgi:hypothetical protein
MTQKNQQTEKNRRTDERQNTEKKTQSERKTEEQAFEHHAAQAILCTLCDALPLTLPLALGSEVWRDSQALLHSYICIAHVPWWIALTLDVVDHVHLQPDSVVIAVAAVGALGIAAAGGTACSLVIVSVSVGVVDGRLVHREHNAVRSIYLRDPSLSLVRPTSILREQRTKNKNRD